MEFTGFLVRTAVAMPVIDPIIGIEAGLADADVARTVCIRDDGVEGLPELVSGSS